MFRRHPPAPTAAERLPAMQPAPEQSPIRLVDATFAHATSGAHTVVDFWAPWCAPCRSFAPVFEASAKEGRPGIVFASCNIDESPATAALLQIQTIPTLLVFGPEGSELRRVSGAMGPRHLSLLLDEIEAHVRATP